jgi:D-serine deaminase-like pyridoxal phosphate-dependent protein
MSRRPTPLEVLIDDIRRLAGLAEAAVGEAARLKVEVPVDVARCVAAWRSWSWRLREEQQEGEGR